MSSQIAKPLALGLLILAAFPVHAAGEVEADGGRAPVPQAFFVIVDEYELSEAAESDASGTRLLELIAEGHSSVSHVRRCAVTATVGVPTRATFRQEATSVHPSVFTGTSVNILLEHCGSEVKLQLRYEASSMESRKSDETRGPVVSAEIESTLLLLPGDVRLCGLLKQGSAKVFTVKLDH